MRRAYFLKVERKGMGLTIAGVAGKLKEMIDENGPEYLSAEPYEAYKNLFKAKEVDRKTAGALLMLFVSGIPDMVKPENDPESLSKLIQEECGFNKEMADTLADIMLLLHTRDNENEWKRKNLSGLEEFRREELSIMWEGTAAWETSGGGVYCYYDAEIVVKPTKKMVIKYKLSQLLDKNHFAKAADIGKIYEKDLTDFLNSEFWEYCTRDDYYQPVVEDFDIEYYIQDWCKASGFELISCEGDGGDIRYEPDSVRR